MPTKQTRAMDRKILHEMMSIPTAPFAEHLVIDYVVRALSPLPSVTRTRDTAGNLLVHIKQGRRQTRRPVCITAHLDHPGFVADRMTKRALRAFWRGGVPPEYFVGTGVKFWVDDRWVKGKVRHVKVVTKNGRKRVETADIDTTHEVPPGSIGMWDLPDPRERGGRIYARGCDDMAGAAAMVCCIHHLVRRQIPCDTYFLFTRAEEVGFVGAIAAAKLGTIPKKCIVVAMETSSELPHAKMGDGPVLRVGDRTSVFTPAVTAYCQAVANDLASRDKKFVFQRRLMDGGTCESSAYCQLGYEATGMCLALGNYHNVDIRRKKIAPEYIDLADFDKVVKWFVELARAVRPYTARDKPLLKILDGIERDYRTLVRKTVAGPA